MLPLDFILTVIVLAVVLGFALGFALNAVQAPVRVRLKNWHYIDSGYEPCEDDEVAPGVARRVADLEDLGFVVRGHRHLTGHSIATGQITLMEHPRTLDVAKVLVTAAGRRRQHTIFFQTRFEDGTDVGVGNNALTVGLPSLPETTYVWVPEVRDPRRLYRVHEQVRDGLGAGKQRLPIGPDPADFLEVARERILAHYVATGYFFLDAARCAYRPTWKGAVLMSWRLLWPIRPLYRAWRRRPSRKLLRELGVSLDPD
jgi:hypothetical protein